MPQTACSRRSPIPRLACLCMGLAICAIARSAEDVPFTQVLDTQTRSAGPWLGPVVARHKGWKPVPEDVLEHRFLGDAAMSNDRLALLLRAQGSAVELYGREVTPAEPCVTLTARRANGAMAAKITRWKLIENTPSTAAAEVEFAFSEGRAGTMQLRLTTGQPIVEVRIVRGIDQVAVLSRTRFFVVPDFFGNDQVFEQSSTWKADIPADNQLVQLAVEDLMVLSVSPKPFLAAKRVTEQRTQAERTLGCALAVAPDAPLWVAVLQGHRLWHAVPAPASPNAADQVLAWQPPFPAKWRANLAQADGYAKSWYFGGDDQVPPAPGGDGGCPCRVEGGRAVVKWSPELGSSDGHSLLLYPMDRSRATPLTTVLPIDVLRNTLGVGPCQYLLKSEGLSTESDPTPAAVMDEVERLFSRKRDRQSADTIDERLDEMLRHIANAQHRIDQYRKDADNLQRTFESCAKSAPSESTAAADAMRRELGRLRSLLANDASRQDPSAECVQLATEIRKLVGQPNVVHEVRNRGAKLREIGEQQDKIRSGTRQLYRRLSALASQHPAPRPWEPLLRDLSKSLTNPANAGGDGIREH